MEQQRLTRKCDSQEWYARFQAWALRCLRRSMTIPLQNADMLRAVTLCLASEDLLSHQDTLEVSVTLERQTYA